MNKEKKIIIALGIAIIVVAIATSKIYNYYSNELESAEKTISDQLEIISEQNSQIEIQKEELSRNSAELYYYASNVAEENSAEYSDWLNSLNSDKNALYNHAYELGYEKGINDVDIYENAYDEGYNVGYDDGKELGYDEGYDDGYDDGHFDSLLD